MPALAAVRADATARGLRVLLRAAPAPTHGDPVLVERVVGNLLENAVRHNVAGGWLEVCTGTTGDGPAADGGAEGGVELRVASSGPEVPADRVDELFEPFRRGPVERTSAARGAGLGLSIVRAVVLAHGGSVAAPAGGGGWPVRDGPPPPLSPAR